MAQKSIVVVAGGTGNLGGRIVAALLQRGADVVVLVRPDSDNAKVEALRARGARPVEVDMADVDSIASACRGAGCVVSAVLGLRDVMVDAQQQLVRSAIAAGVPRFIPSDYCLDFTKLDDGDNRNLDLHRAFKTWVDAQPIATTSIFNGAFMDMLTGQAPFILFRFQRVLYWRSADQILDFTTMDDTAAFTAAAALDPSTPRLLKISGDAITSRGLAAVMTSLTGTPFRPQWAGTLGTLKAMIAIGRLVHPAPDEPFPAWQGMQYSHNMFAGRAVLAPLDNGRYPDIAWTSARDVLRDHLATVSATSPQR